MTALNEASKAPMLKEKGMMLTNTENHLKGMYSSFILLIAVINTPVANP